MGRKTAKDFFDEPVVERIVGTEKTVLDADSTVIVEEDEKVPVLNKEVEAVLVKANNEKITNTTTAKDTATTDTNVTPEQALYQLQYQQYLQQCQQYQQYYSQYYAANAPVNTPADPVYELYTGQPTTSASSQPPAASFDAGRANRQMAAYFDPTKFQAVLSPEMLAAQQAQKNQQQARLTSKDIEAFKKKKIEKKKGKNRWFYE